MRCQPLATGSSSSQLHSIGNVPVKASQLSSAARSRAAIAASSLAVEMPSQSFSSAIAVGESAGDAMITRFMAVSVM